MSPKAAGARFRAEKRRMCAPPIGRRHYTMPRSKGGADTIRNQAGVCRACHDQVRKDAKAAKAPGKLKSGTRKKHAGASMRKTDRAAVAGGPDRYRKLEHEGVLRRTRYPEGSIRHRVRRMEKTQTIFHALKKVYPIRQVLKA